MAGDLQVFERLMDQGHSAAWDQSWDLAATYYRQALEEFPDHPQALVSLGLAYFELNSNQRALQCYLEAARLMPQDPMPAEKISQLYLRMGNLDRAYHAALHAAELYAKNRDLNKALHLWERAAQLKPEQQRAYSRMAAVYERLGKQDQALEEYLTLARLQQSAGQLEGASASIEHALTLAPGSTQALQYQALLKDSQPLPRVERKTRPSDSPIGTAFVNQVVELAAEQSQPGSDPIAEACTKALSSLAGLLFEPAETDQSNESKLSTPSGYTRRNSRRRGSHDHARMLLHLSQVIDLQSRREYEQSTAQLQLAVEAGLDHPAGYFDLGYLESLAGRTEEALDLLRLVFNQADFALAGHLLSGEIYRQKDQAFEASMQYLEALKWADILTAPPASRENLLQLYGAWIEAYRLEPSSEFKADFCDTVTHLLMRWDWRLQVEQARGQGNGSPPALAEALAVTGGNQVLSALGRVRELKRARRLRSAMEEVFYALEVAPFYLPLHTLMADLLVELGETHQAVVKYKIVARVYSMRGEGQQAISLFRKVIELAPAEIDVRNQLVAELLASGQVDEAALEKMKLAEIYMNLADLSMARQTYSLALKLEYPSQISLDTRIHILERIADIDLQTLDWRQAVRVYEQIRALQPENEHACSQLVNLYFRLGQESAALRELNVYTGNLVKSGRHSRALEVLEELARDYPSSLHVRQLLADAYRDCGRSQEAVAQYDWIGEKLLTSGDRPGAIASVRQIISLNPPNRPEYEQLLAQLSTGKL